MVETTRPVVGLVLIGMIVAEVSGGASHASPGAVRSFSHPTSPIHISSTDLHSATIKDLRRRIEQDPTQPELHLSLGKVLESMGDLPGAIVEYTETLRLNPNHSEAFYYLSQARRVQRAREEAPEPNSNQLEPKPALVHQDFVQGMEWIAQGRFTEAIARFRHGLLEDPGSQIGRLQLAEALLLIGEVDGAIGELRALIRIHPALTQGYLRLGAALMAKQDWPAAKIVLEDALLLDSGLAEAHYNLGIVNYTVGNVEEALVSYRQALEHNPEFSDAHFRLGLMLKIAGKSTEAVQAFQAAADLGMPRAEYFLGVAYRHGSGVTQDLSKALHWLFRASEHGIEPARTALVQLRREALGLHVTPSKVRRNIQHAFHVVRDRMWTEFPDLIHYDNRKTVGMTLLQMGRVQEAIPVLIREASALSEESHQLLELIYEEGVGSDVPQYDERIMSYFQQSADEGLPRPRMMLARIYGAGLGVKSDRDKALTLLQGHPDPEAQRLVQELLAGHVPVP